MTTQIARQLRLRKLLYSAGVSVLVSLASLVILVVIVYMSSVWGAPTTGLKGLVLWAAIPAYMGVGSGLGFFITFVLLIVADVWGIIFGVRDPTGD